MKSVLHMVGKLNIAQKRNLGKEFFTQVNVSLRPGHEHCYFPPIVTKLVLWAPSSKLIPNWFSDFIICKANYSLIRYWTLDSFKLVENVLAHFNMGNPNVTVKTSFFYRKERLALRMKRLRASLLHGNHVAEDGKCQIIDTEWLNSFPDQYQY